MEAEAETEAKTGLQVFVVETAQVLRGGSARRYRFQVCASRQAIF